MKRVLLAFAATAVVAMLATPVMAATEWNFGASLRFMTFWSQVDYGKGYGPDLEGGGNDLRQDGRLDWTTQSNSRIKMFMKSDNLQGFIELGYNTDENKVTTREFWGKYMFGNGWAIQIGQSHQLFNTPGLSNQAWGGDMNMHSIGTSWNPPTPKVILSYGGFSFALSETYKMSRNLSWGNVDASGDVDTYFPQVQAAYQFNSDTWRLKLAGAYQYTRVKDYTMLLDPGDLGATPPVFPTYSDPKKEDFHSWLVSLDGDINFGPLYLAGAASVGQNWSDAQWNTSRGGLANEWTNQKSIGMSGFEYKNGKLEKTTSAMGAIIAGYRLTEALRLEAGVGYRYDDNDAWTKSSNMWNVYLQAAYTVIPGFNITPEIGYIDLGKTISRESGNKGVDAGYIWYAGAKWQMDF